MRTTLDIDAPILRDLKRLQRKEGKSLGRLVSDLLARALEKEGAPKSQPFHWPAKKMGESRVDLADKDAVQALLDADTAAVYASGHLLFVRQETLFAQAFDPVRLTLTGNPFSLAEQITVEESSSSLAAVSASATGSIVYRTGIGVGQRQLVWVDRSGNEIAKLGTPDRASTLHAELSPDGRRVAVSRVTSGNQDIWLLETARGVLTRFTSDPGVDVYPIWSPDGSRIVFSSS